MRRSVLILALLAVVLLLWETGANSHGTIRLLFSSPSRIAAYLPSHQAQLWIDSGKTIVQAAAGLTLATIVALLTALAAILFPVLLRFLLPFMIMLQVIPLIVIAPMLIVAFGTGWLPMIIMSAILAYFPVFINLANGIRHTDPNLIDFLTLQRATRWQKIVHGYRVACTPAFFASQRIAVTLAVIGAIVAQFSGAPNGLGRNFYVASLRIEPEMLMCTLLFAALIGYVLYGAVVLAERLLVRWYRPGLGLQA